MSNPNILQCRICYENDIPDNLINPCNCNGSIKYVHLSCLQTWIQQHDNIKKCPVCNQKYNFGNDVFLLHILFIFYMTIIMVIFCVNHTQPPFSDSVIKKRMFCGYNYYVVDNCHGSLNCRIEEYRDYGCSFIDFFLLGAAIIGVVILCVIQYKHDKSIRDESIYVDIESGL